MQHAAILERDILQFFAVSKCFLPNHPNAARYLYKLYPAILEATLFYRFQLALAPKCNALELCAITESPSSQERDAVSDDEVPQTAVEEAIVAYLFQAASFCYLHILQFLAVRESVPLDLSDALREDH